MNMDNVCIAHCCLIHGCKYGNTNCVVANGVELQKYPCEYCSELGITSVNMVHLYDMGHINTCPHCKHVLK